MKNPVRIKGTTSGLIIVIDEGLTFDEAKKEVKEKIITSAAFFGKGSFALAFEGKELTDAEKYELADIVAENSELNIVCITESRPEIEAHMKKALNDKLSAMEANTGTFYKGIEFESSVVVLGDVNAGAQVVSKGNIIILGALYGNAFAGVGGRMNSFVAALNMNPAQIRIGDIIARSSDSIKKPDKTVEPKIAFCEDGNIYIEDISLDSLNDIKLD